jgi:hypothetical protein
VDRQLDNRVAVKVLNPEYTADEDHIARFRQEALSAAKIRHPHLVDVTDQGYTRDGLAYFVMEYMVGESLGEHVNRMPGPMPWWMVVEIVVQVCTALEVAHEHGIIHRDIKPGNCFMEQRRGTGEVIFIKVLDLGIAKVRAQERDAIGVPSTRNSQGVPGTPEYMAPELARGLAYDRRVDIYALGIMMYRLLTGELPFFSAKSPFATLEAQCYTAPRPPRELNPQIPARLEEVVLTALRKQPDERYSTAAELAAALQRVRTLETTQEAPDERTQHYVNTPPMSTTARRLVHVCTAFGGFTTAAAMFMILMLFEMPGQTAPRPRIAESNRGPKVIIQEPRPVETKAVETKAEVVAPEVVEEVRGPAESEAPGKAVEVEAEPEGPVKVAEPKAAEPKAAEPKPVKAAEPGPVKAAEPKAAKPAAPRDPDGKMVGEVLAKAKRTISAACKGKLSVFEDAATVTVGIDLGASGRPIKVAATAPHAGTNLGRCVENEVSKLAFRKPTGSKLRFAEKIVVRRK